MSEQVDPRAEAKLREQVGNCLRLVMQADAGLEGLAAKTGTLEDDVVKLIGGSAERTDVEMVSCFTEAFAATQAARSRCAQAISVGRRVGM